MACKRSSVRSRLAPPFPRPIQSNKDQKPPYLRGFCLGTVHWCLDPSIDIQEICGLFFGYLVNLNMDTPKWPLSDTAVKNARAKAKSYKKYDEHGLFLLLNPKGKKWWRFKYRFDAKNSCLLESIITSTRVSRTHHVGVNESSKSKSVSFLAVLGRMIYLLIVAHEKDLLGGMKYCFVDADGRDIIRIPGFS